MEAIGVFKVETVAVHIPPEEARLFEEFKHKQSSLGIILRSGVLDIKAGSFVVHLDSQGVIQRIDRHDTLYRI